MKNKELFWQTASTIPLLKESLDQNRISITSTDTIYGFLANTSPQGARALQELKELVVPRPYLILIKQENLDHFVDTAQLTSNMLNVIKNCWPGPLTIVFTAKPSVPAHLKSPSETIALRCPDHVGLQALLTHFNGLFSTSANKAMEPAPDCAVDINPKLITQTDYFVRDTKKEIVSNLASTIIDFSDITNKKLTILRPGAYAQELLEQSYEK